MADPLSVNTLYRWSIDSPRIAALGIIALRAFGFIIVVPKDTSPLLHRLLVVLRAKCAIRAPMVYLHLRARAIVTGIHVEDDIGPSLRGGDSLTIGACIVPCVDAAGRGDEAASAHARIDDSGLEHIRVGSCKHVL